MQKLIPYCLFLVLTFLSAACSPDAEERKEKTLFRLLPPERTNIFFVNQLEEGLNTNVLMYEYFYNGGGVAAGDINGDGLVDLCFTTNMGRNALYLNQGNLKFEEVAQIAGLTGRPGPWKTGVSFVDINGDNRLDVYYCYSGALPDSKRTNQLFINQGNNDSGVPIFSEQTGAYGLNTPAFSNQSYFLDYDRDGDLDMLLLNHNPKSLPILNENSTQKMLRQPDPLRGVRLFKQENGTFRDVTERAGISGSELTYGLGLGIGDFNNDNWPDFYVSNDYAVPDYLYLNNQDGTFTDQLASSIGHNSQFSMGNDIGDINNDGLQDIVTLDMMPEDNRRQKLLMAPDNYAKFDLNVRSGFHYQYMRNMLQLNNGNGTFSEIGQLAGIAKTDWSWAALLADYDNDGWNDLLVTNGYLRDYTNLDFIKYMDDFVQRKGRLQRNDVLDLISRIPASDVANYLFRNNRDLTFTNVTEPWGLSQVANSNGAVYADLDNDGDLDLILNNINKPAFLYENRSSGNNYLQVRLIGEKLNTQGIGTKVELYAANKHQVRQQVLSRGYLSSVSELLHFGLGPASQIDSLAVTWPTGKVERIVNVAVNQVLELKEKDASDARVSPRPGEEVFRPVSAGPDFTSHPIPFRDFDRQALLPSEFSHHAPCMVLGDLDQNGLEDIFIGGVAGQSGVIFFQQKTNRFSPKSNSALAADARFHDADAQIFDANQDGFPDLYVASGGYHDFQPDDPRLQDRLYLNDGNGRLTRSLEALPEDAITATGTVAIGDVDRDGDPDIFVGGRIVPGRYPEPPASFLLLNDGRGKFVDQTALIAPSLKRIGMLTDALWVDIENDGQDDLILVGEWLPITVYANENGRLQDKTEAFFSEVQPGWWNVIDTADLNKDGHIDLLAGNLGTNALLQADPSRPAELHYRDFDQNGSVDPILTYFIGDRSYPDVTRDEMLGQLTHLRSKYTSYESYANQTLDKIFTAEELKLAEKLVAGQMATSLFLGTDNGKFAMTALPVQAQFAPVHTINIFDYDEDGHLDALLCGNNSKAKLRFGKFDANYGCLLKGEGDGRFRYIDQTKSGLDLRGDIRSVVKSGNRFYFGISGRPVVTYELMPK